MYTKLTESLAWFFLQADFCAIAISPTLGPPAGATNVSHERPHPSNSYTFCLLTC